MPLAADLPATTTTRPARLPVLGVIGFQCAILSYAIWPGVGAPAPLLGLLAVVLCWLAIRRQRPHRGAWLSRWGLGLGLLKLTLFAAYFANLVSGEEQRPLSHAAS
jgi:hypothetical protein